MKMAQITLPLMAPVYGALSWQHEQLKRDIVNKWNGYTAWPAQGMWQDADGNGHYEEVMVYQIAMPRADVILLRALASAVAAAAGQQCVMIVTPNGDVEFIKPREKIDAPA